MSLYLIEPKLKYSTWYEQAGTQIIRFFDNNIDFDNFEIQITIIKLCFTCLNTKSQPQNSTYLSEMKYDSSGFTTKPLFTYLEQFLSTMIAQENTRRNENNAHNNEKDDSLSLTASLCKF